MSQLTITIHPEDRRPPPDPQKLVVCEEIFITETAGPDALPLIDFKMRDASGRVHLMTLPGRAISNLEKVIVQINRAQTGIDHP